MDVSRATDTVLQSLTQADGIDARRMQLQMALLKKTLQTQEDQGAELRRMVEGKGQILDLRV